ncbi:MAG TPA: hypothetical protein VK469_15700 [Candidatus Kapabacteria bacterium]|nr:hypothetical protein [Candidatus Kapabacteria bacterium]
MSEQEQDKIEIKIPKKAHEELMKEVSKNANGCGCGCALFVIVQVNP